MFYKTIWEYWKKFGKILGKIQTTIILTVIYFLVISPVGLIKSIFTPKKLTGSYWLDLPQPKHSLEENYEQY